MRHFNFTQLRKYCHSRESGNPVVQRLLTAFLLAILMVLLIAGCGYHFTPTGENIGRDVKNVYVGVFTNGTAEPNIEMVFRNAFIDQFIKGRRFKTVNSEEAADAVIKGDIKNLLVSPLAYRGDNIAIEKRLAVTMAVTLKARSTNKIIWSDDNFSQTGDYAVSGMDATAGDRVQKNALVKLANDAAERAYRMMISDF
jgi:hypothetical protein